MLLQVEKLTKTFRSLRRRVEAVRGVDFAAGPGEIIGFVGPNGAGKSTTIKMILGFLRPDAGHIRLFGRSPGDPGALVDLGFMPEHPAFPDTLTGAEWLRYAYRLARDEEPDRDRIDGMLTQVGLAAAGDRLIRGYSKGMLQRLGLAQARIAEPRLLILDEPLSGLDPLGRALFKELLREEAARGRTIFFSSHILDDVEHLCSRVILLNRGKVVVDAPLDELLYRDRLSYRVRYRAERPLHEEHARLGEGLWEAVGLSVDTLQALLADAGRRGLVILEVAAERPTLEQLFLQWVGEEDT